ncbi:helix-turn-helix domain-containing protein [Noviherbaspirillum cavernae]|uniref:Helix-turn-helix domain-containing protein n=1 Tax=Noviherbaspirillum cavernae TaxID=2320862 RepID=A0A418WWF0_9BURK|nr:helix-turn-helix domain-containing protein [Noviherbaspirillum cavernae]RJF97030.1 helix-turn-helix domain-containing protein [Noviherbaspirillum cavernae]
MPATLRIGLLLFPRCMPAGLFAFADLVRAANRRAGRMLFDTRFVALDAGTVECAHGISLTAASSTGDGDLDAILIPGFWGESPQQVADALADNGDLIAALSALPKKIQLWSYCTGVCLLAATGKLNGQPATVTWWLADAMIRQHAKVQWQSERNCIVNQRTATASGVNGYLPIAQALIERYLSAEAFRDLTRLMVLPRPEQAHLAFQSLSLIEQSGRFLRKLHMLVEQLPAEAITVQRLAQTLGMSERTLARKVRAESGLAVAAYARRIKLNQASERLILTSVPASTISAELGFSSDSNMRRMFKELTALTPAEYRQRYGRN